MGKAVQNINLDEMTLADLKQLKKDVDRAIESFNDRRKAEAAEELEALARERGFSLADLSSIARKKRKPAAAKYRHPENPQVTWSGRGRRPRWVNEALEQGRTLSDMAV